jgi:hypothetical protein
MIKFLFLAIAVLLFKFINNLVEYLRCKRYLDEYYEYLEGGSAFEFEKFVPRLLELFENAGIEDKSFPLVQPAGYGRVFTGEASIFSNITHKRKDIVASVVQMFHRAIGVYHSRMLETFNPLYWVRSIVYLPKQILSYLGVSSESTVVRILQVAYWLTVPVIGWVYALFKTEIDQFMKDFITSLIS